MAKKDKTPRIMTSEQMKEFIKENNIQTVEDIQSVLKNLFAETLQGMLEGELDTQLGYISDFINVGQLKVKNLNIDRFFR